ncbi:MAG: hypothetical protein V3U26_03675 [Dehalococcoidia bacterium]
MKKAHRALRPGGILLDIHPEPDHSGVEVQVNGRRIQVGQLDESAFIEDVHAARRVLVSIVDAGHFAPEEERVFEFLYHFDGVDALGTFLTEDWRHAEIAPAVLSRARGLLAEGEGEVLIREPVRAARLSRL